MIEFMETVLIFKAKGFCALALRGAVEREVHTHRVLDLTGSPLVLD